jgi:glycosyltransferase involved in cell wall biosynthesis
MKLCYVLPKYETNSAENFYHIVNFLEELGKKVDLYLVVEKSIGKPKISNLKKVYVIDSGQNKLPYLYRFIKLLKIYFELCNMGVYLFFIRSSITGVLPFIIGNRFLNFNRSKIIFWSCGQDIVPLSYYPNIKNFKRITSKILAKLSFKLINYLATGPELMSNFYHIKFKIPLKKILLLYNDISLERFKPLTPKIKEAKKQQLLKTNKKIMLFVHTFNKSRGAEILPLIANKIKDDSLDILLIAIGRPGDYSQMLNKKIKEEGLSEHLINLGQIANKDIVDYYQISDLFIMPSRGEGFPRVILEAMASGCPVISFNVGGVANIIPEDTFADSMVPEYHDQQFITKSIELINDKKLLMSLSKKFYDKVKNYETCKIVEMYVRCLTKINKK